jgi:mannose-6-phosphate isomerase-like protein (cupin superfamily)
MQFIRPFDEAQTFDTGFPGYRAQIVAQLESALFIASTIEEGGAGPGLHYHHSDQLYFLLRGNMCVRLGDDVHRIGPSTLVHIPAGVAHCNWNEGPGPETHLEVIIPCPEPGRPIANPVERPGDVPADRRAMANGTVTAIDRNRLGEPLPGFRVAALADPGIGMDRMVVNYAEVAPGSGGPGTHVHEFDQSYFVLDGELSVDVGLQHHVVGPNTLVLLPAGVPHQQRNDGAATERHLTFLTPAPIEGQSWDYGVDFAPNGDDHQGRFTRRQTT